MATLSVRNKTGEALGEVTAADFVRFKKEQQGRVALLVDLGGNEILIDTCKLFKQLPSANYTARLLKLVPTRKLEGSVENIESYEAWKEV